MLKEYDLGPVRGLTGAVGPAGKQGPQGLTPSIVVGEVTTLPPGEHARVSRREGSVDEMPVLDFALPAGAASSGDMQAAIYDPRNLHQDVFAYAESRTGKQSATVVVAAADSLNKQRADFVCDGIADQITIQRALNTLPATGGLVQLMEGSYLFDGSSYSEIEGYRCLLHLAGEKVQIAGLGAATRIAVATDLAADAAHCLILLSGSGCTLRDLLIDGSAAGAQLVAVQLAESAENAELHSLQISGCTEAAIISFADKLLVQNCRINGCGCGISSSGNSCIVRQSSFCGNEVAVQAAGNELQICSNQLQEGGSGILFSGGQRLIISGNLLFEQPVAMKICAASYGSICGNLVQRGSLGSWLSGEYALRMENCNSMMAVGNYLAGQAVSLSNCSDLCSGFGGLECNFS